MRVIYRSASKLRLHSNFYSWIVEATKSAIALFVYKVGEGTITRFFFSAVAWVIFSSCLPLEIFVLFLAWLHTIVLVPVVRWLEPDAVDVEVINSGSFRMQSPEEEINSQLITLVVTAEGPPPDIDLLRQSVQDLVTSVKNDNTSKLEQILQNRMGCKVWKRDNFFHVANHVKVTSNQWRGVSLTEDAIRYWVDDFCNCLLPCNHPPWQMTIVPYHDNVRTECHAFVIRIHRELVSLFRLSDILTECEPINLELKKAVTTALSRDPTDKKIDEIVPFPPTDLKSTIALLNRFFEMVKKVIRLAWIAPWVLYTELLCSCRYWMPRHFRHREGRSGTRRTKVLFWSEEFPHALIRKIRDESGASTSSVLISCIAGAMKQYYRVTGERTPEDILAYIPIYNEASLRVNESLPDRLGTLAMPMGITDPINRLKAISKRLVEPSVRQQLSRVALKYANLILPPVLIRIATEFISRKYLAVINNVYISDTAGKIFGSNATNLFYWRPLLNYTGISLTLMNYQDKVSLAVMGKRESLQRPDILVASFQRELYDLALALDIRMERKPTPPPSPYSAKNNLYNSCN